MSGTIDATQLPPSPSATSVGSLRRRWRGRSGERLAMLAIWAVGALAIALATRGIAKWYVMTDELSYLKQALFIARHLRLPLAGDPFYNSHSDLLPLLGAPLLALFPTVTALKVFHVVAAVAMASTAVPVYLLARRVTRSPALAALAGALAIGVPWVAMSAGFMSEIVAYPVAAWAFLAIHEACVRPGPRSDAIALLAIALACFARAQLVVMLPVLVACVAVDGLASASGAGGARARLRVVLRSHRLLAVAAGLGLCAAVLAIAVPSIASALLGNYGATTSTAGLIPPGIGRQTRFELGTHLIAIGVLPFTVGIAFALAALVDRRDRPARAAAVLILLGSAALVLQAGWFTDRFRSYDDRYLMYLAPLLAVGFVAGLERPWRLRYAALPAAALTWYALHGVPIVAPRQLYLNSISTVNYAAIRRWTADVAGGHPATALALLACAALAVTVALGALRRRWVAPVAVGVPFLAVSLLALANIFKHERQDWRATVATQVADPIPTHDWVDRAVGSEAHVAALLGVPQGAADPAAVWWDTSYWNQSLDHDYAILPGGVDLQQNYATRLRIRPADGRVENLHERLAVLPQGFVGFGIRGAHVLRGHDGLQLLRLPRHPRLAWRLGGQGAYGDVSGRRGVTLTIYAAPAARSCLATARFDPAGRAPVRARIDVPPGRAGRATLRLRDVAQAHGPARARLVALAVTCRSR